MIYEEFFADPVRRFAHVLQFLALPADPARTSFPRINPTLRARSVRLQGLLAHPPPWLKALSAPLKLAAHAAGLDPMRNLDRLNHYKAGKPPIRPAFRQELERYFAADVAESEALLGRPLWPMAHGAGAGTEAAAGASTVTGAKGETRTLTGCPTGS